MEYTIDRLAKLAGVSTRTLRYYDQCGLLTPVRNASNGYRIYGRAEVDRLQQILFYRELGLSLEDIGSILSHPDFNRQDALKSHLATLEQRRQQLDRLIETVEKTISESKGECTMTDHEKFDGFRLVEENERRYGKEIRAKYGDEAVDRSNKKIQGMTAEDLSRAQALEQEVLAALKQAMEHGDPAGPEAQHVCDLHRQWLCSYSDSYSKEYHRNLGELYVSDPRFAAYYDAAAPGCAAFLKEALDVYCR